MTCENCVPWCSFNFLKEKPTASTPLPSQRSDGDEKIQVGLMNGGLTGVVESVKKRKECVMFAKKNNSLLSLPHHDITKKKNTRSSLMVGNVEACWLRQRSDLCWGMFLQHRPRIVKEVCRLIREFEGLEVNSKWYFLVLVAQML